MIMKNMKPDTYNADRLLSDSGFKSVFQADKYRSIQKQILSEQLQPDSHERYVASGKDFTKRLLLMIAKAAAFILSYLSLLIMSISKLNKSKFKEYYETP